VRPQRIATRHENENGGQARSPRRSDASSVACAAEVARVLTPHPAASAHSSCARRHRPRTDRSNVEHLHDHL
jgi:hypothetical protein